MDLQHLKTLSTLKYQRSQQDLSGLLKRENELRSELDRMRLLVRQTQAQDPENAQMRAIGADIIWLKWIAKVQRELNMSLAGVLAQKEAFMARHRRATGRKLVAEELAKKQRDDDHSMRTKAQLQTAIDGALLPPSDQ